MIKSEIEARIKYFRKIGNKATNAEYKARLFGQAYGLEMAIIICEDFLGLTTPASQLLPIPCQESLC